MPELTTPSNLAPATVDLLRHGSVAGGDRLRGWQDDPLDTQGWMQMSAALDKDYQWDRIDCSPLSRCADFAEEVGRLAGVTPCRDERWRELHFGAWEGHTVADIQASEPDALSAFWHDPDTNPPPGGERATVFEQRVDAVWAELRAALQPGQRGLLISHGGVIRLLLCRVLGLPSAQQFCFEVPYATRITVVLDARQPRLRMGQCRGERSPAGRRTTPSAPRPPASPA